MNSKTVIISLWLLAGLFASAADWPAHGGDNDRTHRSTESVSFPLEKDWIYKGLKPVPMHTSMWAGREYPVQYDFAPSPVIGNGRVYCNDSTAESVYCLDADTGATNWVFYTEGAVRLAPAYDSEKVYFGSDDGFAYCVNAANGLLVWKVHAATNAPRRAVFSHRLGSSWPVRTGVSIRNGNAWFGGGFLPPQGCYVSCVDADTGAIQFQQHNDYMLSGYPVFDSTWFYIGTGRTAPIQYKLSDGVCTVTADHLSRLYRRAFGGTQLSVLDGRLIYGPNELGISLIRTVLNTSVNEKRNIPGLYIASKTRQFAADDTRLYMLRGAEDSFDKGILAVPKSTAYSKFLIRDGVNVRADDREGLSLSTDGDPKKSTAGLAPNLHNNRAWLKNASTVPDRVLLITANALFAGGEDGITAYNPATGAQLWSRSVVGTVYNLAFADGALYAGTTEGYLYCFATGASGSVDESALTYSSPYPTGDEFYDLYAEAAQLAITNAGTSKGFCMVLGAGEGRLAYEIAIRSDLFVIGLETDPAKAAAARSNLMQTGLYGSRIVIHEDMDELFPHPDYFANLIVSEELLMDGTMPYSSQEIFRMLRPYGGTVLFGQRSGELDLTSWVADDMSAWTSVVSGEGIDWKLARRGERDGFGKWASPKANLSNTFASDDRLLKQDFELQWMGELNPHNVPDRHDIAGAPVVADGTLIVPGLDYITAVDAYNGTILWEKDMPGITRRIASHDAPSMMLHSNLFYVAAGGSCLKLNARTGEQIGTFSSPASGTDWGYVAVHSNILFGTTQAEGASLGTSGDINVLYAKPSSASHPIVSKTLFAKNPQTGAAIWTYDEGAILNSTLTVHGDRVFFAECAAAAIKNDADGRLAKLDDFMANATCVALDIFTGEVVWEKPLDGRMSSGSGHDVVLFYSCWSNRLLSVGSHWGPNLGNSTVANYDVILRDISTGNQIGNTDTLDGGIRGGGNATDHNVALQTPIVTKGKAYFRFYNYKVSHLTAFDLTTGESSLLEFDNRANNILMNSQKGCMPPCASYETIYYRGYTTESMDLTTLNARPVSGKSVSRPGCWHTILPAGGVLLVPEASAACVCGTAMQTSFAMVPPGNDTDAPDLFNVVALDDITVTIVFNEAVDSVTAGNKNNYSLNNGITVSSAVRQSRHLDRVTLTVSTLPDGTNTLTVSGVKDLHGNAMSPQQMDFESGAADSDGDGLPDSWEESYFDNSTSADPSADGDNDGLTNWQEYIAGTDPTSVFSTLEVGDIVAVPGTGFIVTWDCVQERTYRVLWAASLSNHFQPLETSLVWPQNSWTDTLHEAGASGFYKIEVRKP